MKHLIRFVILTAVLAFGVSTAFAGETLPETKPETKIGVLDWQLLLTKAPQAEEAGKRLEKEFQARNDKLVSKKKEFQTKQEKLQRDREVLSGTERSKLENELSKLQQDLRHMDEEFRSDYTARHREEMDDFIKVVRDVVEKLAQEEKYALVLPQEATLFTAEHIDVTNKVLERLATKAVKTSAKPESNSKSK